VATETLRLLRRSPTLSLEVSLDPSHWPTTWPRISRKIQLFNLTTCLRSGRKSRSEYQDFLTLWKDADPAIPVLKQAKAEYAKLSLD
jgi:hypothetical protein